MENLTFKQKIMLLRRDKKISQRELAESLGIGPSNVARYENGRLPTPEILIKISTFFDVSIDYLLKNNYKEKSTTSIKDKQWLELAEKVDALNSLDKKYICDTVTAYLNRHLSDFPEKNYSVA